MTCLNQQPSFQNVTDVYQPGKSKVLKKNLQYTIPEKPHSLYTMEARLSNGFWLGLPNRRTALEFQSRSFHSLTRLEKDMNPPIHLSYE